MEPKNPTLICEVCGARVANLRRGRCWICYVRWAETRAVGNGASCAVCGERRHDNLRLVEFQGSWIPMCHNCGTRTMRLVPIPNTLEAVRQRLARDRRWADRRSGKPDGRIMRKERRVGERRLTAEAAAGEWLEADDLIIEIIEVNDAEETPIEATRIVQRETQAPAES